MTAWPWPSSEQTDTVIPAFVAALQKVEDVARNKRAAIDTKSGGKMQYSYADLDAVLEAVKPELTTHGLAFTQAATSDGVHAIIMHSSGQWLSFPPLQVQATQNTPQGHGSALTYARRYQMLALLNIATEDDDARAASKPRKPAAKPQDTAPPPGDTGPSNAQRARAQILAKELWGDDRTRRLGEWSTWVGRVVTTFNDLTGGEAADVIERMAKLKKEAAA